MVNIFKKILSHEIARNSALLSAGTFASQFLAIVTTPMISRLYGPEIIGESNVVVLIAQILLPISAMSIPFLIVTSRDYAEARDAYFASVLASAIVAVLVMFIIATNGLVSNLNSEIVGLCLLPFFVIFYGLAQANQYFLTREGNFGYIAISAFCGIAFTQLMKIFGGFFELGGFYLVFSSLAGAFISFSVFCFFVFKCKKIKSSDLKKQLKCASIFFRKNIKYISYKVPQGFVNATSQTAPPLMFGLFYGSTQLAFYSMANMFVSAPSLIISKPIAEVLFPLISNRLKSDEQVGPILTRTVIMLAVIGIFPLFLFIFYSDLLVVWFFGDKWSGVSVYAFYLSLWLYVSFISRPFVYVFTILRKEKEYFYHEIISCIFRLLVIYLGFLLWDSDKLSIALLSFVGVFFNIVIICRAFFLISNR